MPLLPTISNTERFYVLLRRPGEFERAIASIRERHRLGGEFRQSETGSTVVFLSAEHCIKLHPPLPGFVASQEREVAALRCVQGRLTIRTPELVGEGQLERWRYFVSSRLPGRPIDAVWTQLDAAARQRLAADLGVAIRGLHALPSDELSMHSEPWPEFRVAQRERCLELERRKGLDAERVAEVEAFLSESAPFGHTPAALSLLHTEIGPSHVLVDEGQLSGLIDFGDAMLGDPEYDLAPVGMFVTRGDAAAFGAFCRAYGLEDAQLADSGRPARLLLHALLHRYGTLAWYLETLAPPVRSLGELARFWFGVG